MTRRRITIGVAALCFAALVACSSLLGLTEPAPYPDDASTGSETSIDDGGDADFVDAGPGTCGADFANDPKNCGKCGHDCLGGACSNKACQPYVVAHVASSWPREIAVTDASVLWTTLESDDGGHLEKCDLPSCDAGVKTLVSNESIQWLVANRTDAFFQVISNAVPYIARCSIYGCNGNFVTVTQWDASPGPFMTPNDSTQELFWTRQVAPPSNLNLEIMECPMSDCTSPRVVLASQHVSGLVTDETYVYYATRSHDVNKILYDGGSQATLVTGRAAARLVSNGSMLFWQESNVGVVGCRLPDCAGPVNMFAASAPAVVVNDSPLTADDRYVYAIDEGRVLRCSVNGCGGHPDVLATSPIDGGTSYDSITVNNVGIFWTDGNAHAVMGLAK